MRLLLPPSETKLKGGLPATGPLTVSFRPQDAVRGRLMVALETFCREEPVKAAQALKLGPKSIEELANNVFDGAPVLPAIDRYTGVLYSATGVADWTPVERDWAATNIFIHSSLLGIISSADPIPNYRLSYDSKVARVSLRDVWSDTASNAIAEMAVGDWVLDCRSEGYRALAPVPPEVESRFLEVVTKEGGKALNHFNKVHKGELVQKLVSARPRLPNPESFAQWADGAGVKVHLGGRTITLAV
ncbi:MAG: YaaA family protein [Microbacteriaceae bacterium]